MTVDAVADEGTHVVHRELGERPGVGVGQITCKLAIAFVHALVARGSWELHGTELVQKHRIHLNAVETR